MSLGRVYFLGFEQVLTLHLLVARNCWVPTSRETQQKLRISTHHWLNSGTWLNHKGPGVIHLYAVGYFEIPLMGRFSLSLTNVDNLLILHHPKICFSPRNENVRLTFFDYNNSFSNWVWNYWKWAKILCSTAFLNTWLTQWQTLKPFRIT